MQARFSRPHARHRHQHRLSFARAAFETAKLYCTTLKRAIGNRSRFCRKSVRSFVSSRHFGCGFGLDCVCARAGRTSPGLRIGAGVAQGLAAPFATPLIGVPCLDAVACQMSAPCVLAATDAPWAKCLCMVRHSRSAPLSDYQVGKAAEIALPPGFVEPVGQRRGQCVCAGRCAAFCRASPTCPPPPIIYAWRKVAAMHTAAARRPSFYMCATKSHSPRRAGGAQALT